MVTSLVVVVGLVDFTPFPSLDFDQALIINKIKDIQFKFIASYNDLNVIDDNNGAFLSSILYLQ